MTAVAHQNIYEEALFRCEDERYELDVLIEQNAAAIRVLEPIVADIQQLTADQRKRCAMFEQSEWSSKRLNRLHTLHRIRINENMDILHVRAIARVYIDQGFDVRALTPSRAI